MLKISAVYLIGKAEIPIHYTIWAPSPFKLHPIGLNLTLVMFYSDMSDSSIEFKSEAKYVSIVTAITD